MRVTVLGGTRFIGRRVVADLAARGDDILVVHRGETEPVDLVAVRHLHTDRAGFAAIAGQVADFAPDAIIDCSCMSRSDVDSVLPFLPADAQLVALSSMDVYQAFHHVLHDTQGAVVPVAEDGLLRSVRYPYRELGGRPDDYDKLDVEPSFVDRGGTVLRLAMIYGEHDHQRREEFVLRRVRAGRHRLPIGAGNWLWTRCFVGDVSRAVLACLGNPRVRGEILNIGEPTIRGMRGWVEEILGAARSCGALDHEMDLVRVPDQSLPEDLWLTRAVEQHVLVDCAKAVAMLDWHPDPAAGLARSVAWHLANPPAGASDDFSADDAALAAAV